MYTPGQKTTKPLCCWLPAVISITLGLLGAYLLDATLALFSIAMFAAIICGAQAFALAASGSQKMAISGSGALLAFLAFLAASSPEGWLVKLMVAGVILAPGAGAIWLALYRVSRKAVGKNRT